MNHFKNPAIFAVLLALSQHAYCAEGRSAKGPLTPAEKADCLAQLAEFNQGVKPYNDRLAELRALRAEIDVLRAELDKESAAIDRTNNAAMDALNAKISKSNGLITRYEEMGSSLTAAASERAARSAKFVEACDNRPAAAATAPTVAPAPPPDSTCNVAGAGKGVKHQLDASFATMRADEKQHQAEVDRVAKAKAKELGWSDEKRGKVFMDMLVSPKFMAFERQKQPYMQELLSILGAKPKNDKEECKVLQRIAATLPAIKAINARQYAYMADAIRSAR